VLFLSQSAVSHALGRLRKYLNDPLFVRDGQGVAPTPQAERLAPEIRAGLALLLQALQSRRAFDPARDLKRFSVAMPDEIEPAVLPQVAARLNALAPQMQLASVRLERRRLRSELASGRLDLAIDIARPPDADLDHALLLRDEFCVLSARSRPLDAAGYLAAHHVAVTSRRRGLAVEDFLLEGAGYQRRIGLRCQHYEAACRIVAASDLLLTLPRRLALTVNAAIGNAVAPLPVDLPAVELHLYWHRQMAEDPGNRWLREQLRALTAGVADSR
jgi:DNA-binding transcriptional LysR family regulator